MSWDEAFADGYEQWSAHMTEDVAFYLELAREADGPLFELAVGNGLWVPETRPSRLGWGFVLRVSAWMIGEWHYDWST